MLRKSSVFKLPWLILDARTKKFKKENYVQTKMFQFRLLSVQVYFFFWTKAYVVGTHKNCLKPIIYVSWSTSELRVRLVRHETGLSPPVKYFYWPFQGSASFVDLVCDVLLWSCHLPIGILGQVWCLIVLIPTGLRSTVGNMSGNICESDCRSRGCFY